MDGNCNNSGYLLNCIMNCQLHNVMTYELQIALSICILLHIWFHTPGHPDFESVEFHMGSLFFPQRMSCNAAILLTVVTYLVIVHEPINH